MNGCRLIPATLALWLVFATMAVPGLADAQPTDSGERDRPKTGYRFSYTPIYQFETDLDSGGSFDVQRHFLRFDISRFINRQWTVGLGLSFDYERWDFSGIAGLSGIDLWDEIFRPGISLPVFYSTGGKWRFGIIPSIDFAGASGAETSESISYGAVLSAAYAFRPNLMLGLGVGIFERLDQSEVFPFVVIDWKINERLRLTNPFRAGPVGPAGLELVYTPDNTWEMGIGGAYRSYRFRLDDSSAVADGIGEVDFWAPFLRVGWRLGEHYRFDINGGALVGGSITIEDQNANELGKTDYDTAPFLGVTLKGQF
ncbi:DUF6268 family outer membrane beta-barrel protein [Desulfosarcina sp.]|uniref:DUF6268 family outer membrane beta-barrel protein n=1 Tax=Desulfosarcina sp. TaxID=2027861 RepID=UPI0029B35B7D|nr:DUF6268 family outer membrane beta-barrel protein [Desulfosarcina sp.]MDX2452544.1 DUF6268 family outer membrane beta-barrel protein [Desulfosarcina sp.]